MTGTFIGWPTFPVAAEHAVADKQLRANLHRATHTIRAKRAELVAERPDWQDLRDAAQAVKDQALAHLDRFLVQAEAQVKAAGGTVHWAYDAEEANRIVTDLVKATGQTEVIKVKSMLTEELDLNQALAKAGIDAWETDLVP
jgi:L-lactate dehydrogenase complex protein LldF